VRKASGSQRAVVAQSFAAGPVANEACAEEARADEAIAPAAPAKNQVCDLETLLKERDACGVSWPEDQTRARSATARR
jgi:hypothetical protein